MKIKKIISALIIPIGLISITVNASEYTVNDLGAGIASGINNLGDIVGNALTADNRSYNNTTGYHATLWSNGNTVDLVTLGGAYSTANGINDNGQIVGWSWTTTGYTHAVIWNGTTPSDLGLPGSNGEGFGINSSGQVVGYYDDSGFGVGYGFVSNGTTINSLIGHDGFATAINDIGQITGSYIDESGTTHGALWNNENASPIDLGNFGGDRVSPNSINLSGKIVGNAFVDNQLGVHAFLWKDGQLIDLNSFLDASTKNTGWVLADAVGINNHDQIAVNGYNYLTGEDHVFLLSTVASVPEASTIMMLLVGLAVLGFANNRKQL